jgi:hypothetical protein
LVDFVTHADHDSLGVSENLEGAPQAQVLRRVGEAHGAGGVLDAKGGFHAAGEADRHLR